LKEFKYSVHPTAQAEFEASVLWYKERSIKAAANFVSAVHSAIDLICQAPFRWKQEYRDFRSLGLRKYPFTIMYTIDDQNSEVLIMAIYHQKRNPKKKFRRK
jgi:plasmid stabilization system protein ParE